MRRASSFLAALLALSGASTARAGATELSGLKVVVDVDGAPGLGAELMAAEVRRAIADQVGPLIPSRRLEDLRRDRSISAKQAADPRRLAEAGRLAGAEWVVRVKAQKKGRRKEARARLIDAATAEVQLDLRVPYQSAGEGRGKGEQIAKSMIARLTEVVRSRRALASAAPGVESPAPFAGAPDEAAPLVAPEPPLSPEEERARFVAAKRAALAEQSEPPPPPLVPPTGAPDAGITTIEPAARESSTGVLRVTVGGGAGLVRSYALSSAALGTSALSYTLRPLGLMSVDAELVIPTVGLGLVARAAFRPVQYDIDTGGRESSTPAGALFDATGMATYHLTLAGEGDQSLELIPGLGIRAALASVEAHPEHIIPSSVTLAVLTGAALRIPVTEIFELDVGADGGLIVAYSETPHTSGSGPRGFTLGADLGARLWVTSNLALALDTRLTYDAVAFSGAPTRVLPPDEDGRLEDASVRVVDLRGTVGAAFRL